MYIDAHFTYLVSGVESISKHEPYDAQHPLHSVNEDNVPCALCYISTRVTAVMIPAKTSCPTNWTAEYTGYLISMTAAYTHYHSTYECVDKAPECVDKAVPGLGAGISDNHWIYHVEPHWSGLPCPPYDAEKELTCVACSR